VKQESRRKRDGADCTSSGRVFQKMEIIQSVPEKPHDACLSLRPSVTFWYYVKTAKHIVEFLLPHYIASFQFSRNVDRY